MFLGLKLWDSRTQQSNDKIWIQSPRKDACTTSHWQVTMPSKVISLCLGIIVWPSKPEHFRAKIIYHLNQDTSEWKGMLLMSTPGNRHTLELSPGKRGCEGLPFSFHSFGKYLEPCPDASAKKGTWSWMHVPYPQWVPPLVLQCVFYSPRTCLIHTRSRHKQN